MSAYPPSHPFDSDLDHRGVLNIVSWFLAIASTFVVCARLGTRWVVSRTFEPDDGLIVAALVLAIAQTGTLSGAVGHGLGLVQDTFDPGQLDGQQKDIYAFNILFVVSQALAKSSLVVFIRVLTPVEVHRRLCLVLLGTIVAWAIAAFFGFLFQCSLANTWQFLGNTCINRIAFYTVMEAFNGILDMALIAIPTTITLSLHLKKEKKLIIITTFFARILVIAAIVAQLAILHSSPAGPDPFLTWSFVLATQIVEYLSIISANGPYLRPFLESLSSGMIGNDDIRRRTIAGTQLSTKLSTVFATRRRPSRPADALPSPMPPLPSPPRDVEKFALQPVLSPAAGKAESYDEADKEYRVHGQFAPATEVIQQTRTFSVRSSTRSFVI